ncbi:MAG TPA: transporter [Allosphingosinicella sp.]|nr:transporter [Allosphingosinicella sp.]
MTFRRRVVGPLLLLCASAAARAEDLRDFCPDRPGLGTPACTIDKGHGDVEIGIADWTRDRDSGVRINSWVFADTLLRYGVSDRLEAQLEWQGLGIRQAHGTGAGNDRGSGDLRLALRRNLRNPDGAHFSAAIMPFVTLPVGSSPIGGGDWAAGLIVPLSYALPHGVQLAFTGEADAAADSQGRGHHLALVGTAGIGVPLAPAFDATLEVQRRDDQDPSGTQHATVGGVALAWQPGDALQLDAGANVGLSRNAPGVELYAGVSRRF